MNLKESKKGHVGEFGKGKGKGEGCNYIIALKMKEVFDF